MNKERVKKGFTSPGNPSESKSTKDGGKGFDLWLADMHYSKGDSLQPERVRAKFPGVAKEQPAPKEKFPAQKIEKSIPGEASKITVIVGLHTAIGAG